MKTNRVIPSLIASCLGAALLAGCTATETASPAPSSQSSTPPVRGFAAAPNGNVVVERVIDGDTFVTRDNVRVRVLGIDSCEKNTDGGKRAQAFAGQLLTGKTVRLNTEPGVNLDRYDRELRYVVLDNGQDYGELMVQRDDTYVYPKTNDASAAYVNKLRSLDKNGRNC